MSATAAHMLVFIGISCSDLIVSQSNRSQQILSLGAYAQTIKLTLASVSCVASTFYVCDSLLHRFLFSSSHCSAVWCFPLKERPRFGVPFCLGELHLAALKANSRERTHLEAHF